MHRGVHFSETVTYDVILYDGLFCEIGSVEQYNYYKYHYFLVAAYMNLIGSRRLQTHPP